MGAMVAAAALTAKYRMRSGGQAWQAFKARPLGARKFYDGGFEPSMTHREAVLILGIRVRPGLTEEQIKQAHRKVMVANHPDAGGSDYLASKINAAKDVLLQKITGSSFSPL